MITTIIAIIFLCLWAIEYNNFLLWADKFVERKYEGETIKRKESSVPIETERAAEPEIYFWPDRKTTLSLNYKKADELLSLLKAEDIPLEIEYNDTFNPNEKFVKDVRITNRNYSFMTYRKATTVKSLINPLSQLFKILNASMLLDFDTREISRQINQLEVIFPLIISWFYEKSISNDLQDELRLELTKNTESLELFGIKEVNLSIEDKLAERSGQVIEEVAQ